MIRVLFFLIAASLITTLASANDTASMGTASNVRFINNNKIAINREDLTIGPKSKGLGGVVPIVVEYEMENKSTSVEAVQMAFPIPGCDFNQYLGEMMSQRVSDGGVCVKKPEMKIFADGKAAEGKWVTRYLVKGVLLDESDLSKRTKAPTLHHNYIGYILKTGGNWYGPIRDFNLTIKKVDKDPAGFNLFFRVKKNRPVRIQGNAERLYSKRGSLRFILLCKAAWKVAGV